MTDNAGDPAKREKEMEERRERIKKEKEAQGEIETASPKQGGRR